MSNDSWQKTLFVAVLLCLVFSVMVSSAAVVLRPQQEANQRLDVQRNLLLAAGMADADTTPAEIAGLMQSVRPQLVNLEDGSLEEGADPAAFDVTKALRDPATRKAIEPDEDLARIRRRAKQAVVYLVEDNGRLSKVVLPVYGNGLYSTLYGFLALDGDLRTIRGLKFYQQGETAGLGAEVDNPRWLARWPGKLALDESGAPAIKVVKGGVDESSPMAPYQVDGISGATMTSKSVSALLTYWLGPDGFGPFLARLKAQQTEAG